MKKLLSPKSPKVQPQKRTYSVRDMAIMYGVTPPTIRLWAERGDLPPPLRLGRTLRWVASVIDGMLAGQQEAAHAR